MEIIKSPSRLSADVVEASPTQPRVFSIENALQELILGKDLKKIFGELPEHFITEDDLRTYFLVRREPAEDDDWRKKIVLNTLRAAMCITVAEKLQSSSIDGPLPSPKDIVTDETVTFLKTRHQQVMRHFEELIDTEGIHSAKDSVFGIAMQRLMPYFACSWEVITKKTAEHVRLEQAAISGFGKSLPEVVLDRYLKQHGMYKELEYMTLTFDLFQDLVCNSYAVLYRGASGSIEKLVAYNAAQFMYPHDVSLVKGPNRQVLLPKDYHGGQRFMEYIRVNVGKDMFSLNPEAFFLHPRPDKPGGYEIKVLPQVPQIARRATENENGITVTSCPALVEVPQLNGATTNLISAIMDQMMGKVSRSEVR